jgi:hypothetical protein
MSDMELHPALRPMLLGNDNEWVLFPTQGSKLASPSRLAASELNKRTKVFIVVEFGAER